MGKRGNEKFYGASADGRRNFLSGFGIRRQKSLLIIRKFKRILSLHFFLNVKSFEIRSNLYQFELNESNIKNLLYRLSYDNLVL